MRESIYRTYLRVADLSECTLSPDHALNIAEWVIETRPTLRQRWQRLLWGRSHDAERAQAMREKWRRNERMADECTCGMAEQERTGHYPEHADWCDVPSPLDDDETTTPTDASEPPQADTSESEAVR